MIWDLIAMIFTIFALVVQLVTLQFLSVTLVRPGVIDIIVLALVTTGGLLINSVVVISRRFGDTISQTEAKLILATLVSFVAGLRIAYWLIDQITSAMIYAFLR